MGRFSLGGTIFPLRDAFALTLAVPFPRNAISSHENQVRADFGGGDATKHFSVKKRGFESIQ